MSDGGSVRIADGPVRRLGRPRLFDERHAQIIDAFIELVGTRGLERVTLDDVARQAGIARTALRHFVGNRDRLIEAAVSELTNRYIRMLRDHVGKAPGIFAAIDVIFSPEWTLGQSVEDSAFDCLIAEARLNPNTRQSVKYGYDVFMEELASALRRTYPGAPVAMVRDTAYAIVCMAELNSTLQQLGYPRARSAGARALAVTAAERLAQHE